MEWSAIKNERFALRRLLTNEAYHASETSIPKSELVPEKEPLIRAKLMEIAKQIIAVPDSVLVDTYAEEERKKDWISLQKKVVLDAVSDVMAIDTRTRPGHKILDHFMPHFYSVKNYKGTSVRDLFTEATLEKALMQNIQMHSTPYVSEIRRMIVMTGGLGSVTKYRTVTSKAIVLYYKAQKVLDPCAGWGGRMLGSLAAGASYVGCEPDPNTAKGLKGILGDTAIPQAVRSKARILEKPAEIALPELAQLEDKFDLVLTSPPYFNLELYTAGDQSTARYTTWEDWTEKWLKPVILGCLTRLKEGGVSCWSVKNFKTDKKYPLADVTKKIHKDAGWDLVKTVTMTGSGRPGGKRIEEGKEKRESEEETFCFKRAS